MKLLFLDVDGVLNNHTILNSIDILGEEQLVLLKSLVNMSECKIVLSSTWRLFPESRAELQSAFLRHDIPSWIGVTPSISKKPRSVEITSWLRNNVKVPTIAAGIDDDEDIDIGIDHGLPVKFKAFKTNYNHGLTLEIMQDTVKWFNSHKE